MLTQTSNKEKKKKKQRTNFHHHGLKTHHHWLIQLNQMRKPKHQTMKKKGKKKTEKQTSHHQSLIRCKRCEIPCYYQQIRYINSSNVKNTFEFLWKKLRKRLACEALCDCDTAAQVGWARIGEIVRKEVRVGRASFSLWWYWNGDESDLEMKVLCFSEESHWRTIKNSVSRVLLWPWVPGMWV